MDIIVLMAGVSIVIALGFIIVYVQNYLFESSDDLKDELKEDAFCEINMDFMLMNTQKSSRNDVNDLKRKIQTFKNRNRFYKM